jgi:DNA-binding MarR family transcriptional regulator
MSEDESPGSSLPAPKGLHDNTSFLLVKLGRLTSARVADALAREGLRAPHYGAMVALNELGAVPQSKIAQALRTDDSYVVGLVDDLERRGYVERTRDPDDRRRHSVALTPAGREAVVRCERIANDCEAHLLRSLNDDERTAFHDLLRRIALANDARLVSGEKLGAADGQW